MERVFLSFKAKVKALGPKDISRATVRKNNIFDFFKWDVLPQDQRFILGILDEAIAGETEDQDFKILKTLVRFGQKSEEPWPGKQWTQCRSMLASLFQVRKRAHTSCGPGGGGAAGTGGAANFANFPSSLDGLARDWSAELSSILKAPKVLFLQLYTDSPHRKLSRAFRHPVSGCITTCGHMQPATGANMLRRAHDYLVHMGDLVEKVVGQMSMRLEHVGTYRAGVEGVPASLELEHLFGMKELRCLLRTRPLVVPFKDTADGSEVMTALRAVTSHYVEKLTGLLSNSKGLGGWGGGFLSAWSAYQAELALEEVFWGHPLCQEDQVYSVSLETASTDANSLTHTRGCPGPPFCCSSWDRATASQKLDREQTKRIERLFKFCESIEGTVPVLGGALGVVFLEDCYMKRLSNPLGALQGPQPPGKVAKLVELEKVIEDLATRDSFRHPSAFGRAREMAKAKGQHVKDLLTQGLDQLDLKFLPHYTLRDIRKKKVLSWEDGRFVEVLRPGQKPCDESWAAGLTVAVCREIKARSLSFPKNLEVFRENGFPWMRQLLQRLSLHMADKERIIVLTFLSCVGMLMRGELDADILTKHQGLVHRPQIAPKRKEEEEKEKEEEVLEDVQELGQEEEQPVQQRTLSRAIPATSHRAWSEEVLRMSDWNEPDSKKAFNEYIRRCTESSVPYRSYSAFNRAKLKPRASVCF
ncbi:unnamed protein product [Gadus morhua 'NCC']